MKRLFVVLFAIATAAFAGQTKLFTSYEAVRQALLKDSVADVQRTAAALAGAARAEKQTVVAEKADAVAKAADVKAARDAFAKLSDEMIRFRDAQAGERPAVAHCPMVKASWLQEKGEIGNPYSESMRTCGMFK